MLHDTESNGHLVVVGLPLPPRTVSSDSTHPHRVSSKRERFFRPNPASIRSSMASTAPCAQETRFAPFFVR